MSYTTEHKRIKPVLDLARKLDIATTRWDRVYWQIPHSGLMPDGVNLKTKMRIIEHVGSEISGRWKLLEN